MQINLYKKKIADKLFKLFLFPYENIYFLFKKKYSKVFFISDNANWATDKTTQFINKFFNYYKIKTKYVLNEPRSQFLFYTDQYAILKSNFYKYKNIVAIDYQHGISNYIENNLKLLNKIKKFQKNIKLIRVTNTFFKKYLIYNGINENKIHIIPLTVDTNFFYPKNNKTNLRKKYNLPTDKFLIGSFHKDGDGWDEGLTAKLIKGPDIFVKSLINLKKKLEKINLQ